MKKAASLLVLFCLITTLSMGQEKSGKLAGLVTDTSGKPVTYATVSLFQKGHTTEPLKKTFSDKKGAFELTIDTGRYVLAITHLSLAEASLEVTVKPGDNILDTIQMSTTPRLMQNITVTVRKPLIEQGDDRLTYNVESDPSAKSETATDLLRKTPMVTVDGDGNVQLNGQANFKILLNGRETSMFASNAKDALRNFPGAVISKIEVITSPSAKWDAEGVGGLINIITKKKVIGYNGYISSYFSTLSNYSQNLSLNLKSGKLGISAYAGGNGSFNDIKGYNFSRTTPVGNAVFLSRTITGEREGRNLGGYGNVEITYDLDSFKPMAFYGNVGSFRSENLLEQTIITEYSQQPTANGLLLQDNNSSNPSHGFGADFIRRYRNTPDKELSFRFNGQFSRNNLTTNSVQDEVQQDRFVANESQSRNQELTFQVDFAQPLRAKRKLEAGAKAIARKASSDFVSLIKYNKADPFKPNPQNSDRFNYRQEVYSLYSSYNLSWKQFALRFGLRAEHTEVDGNFISAKTEVHQSYSNLIPNILVTRRFGKIYTLTTSYNMRLQRPYITSLNPFINNTDSLNISFGNPNLGPQVLHAVSVQNRFVKGKFFAGINLNSSYTNSMIVQFASFNPATGITSTTSANVGREYAIGLGVNVSTALGEKLNVGANTQLRYNNVENKSDLMQQNSGISGALSGNFNYKVVGKFTISGSGGMFRCARTLVNSPLSNYFYQVNFGYKFFKDKLAITMNVNNFHSRYLQFKAETENPGFRVVSTSQNPYRVVYFGATYNFGKLKENVSKKKGVTNDDLL